MAYFAMITSLGVGFSGIPEMFQKVTQAETSGGEALFRAVLPNGATLKQARNGLFSSSARYADGAPAWGEFELVDTAKRHTPNQLFNPAALAMTVALAQINQKLDGIQSTLDDMFEYLRIKDKADVLASLETLKTILNDYKFNWENASYKQAKYNLVQSINRDARQHIVELRAHLSKKMEKKGLFELRGSAENDTTDMLDFLKDYQLAVYLYSFSIFLGIMLLENYDENYLETKAADIRQKALEYREMYTECFNTIESRNKDSVDSFVLGGLSVGIRGLGKVIEKTPLGDVTLIDEALIGAGSGIGNFYASENERIAKRLIEAKDSAVISFVESIDSINRLYNTPSLLLTDGESLYIVFDGAK